MTFRYRFTVTSDVEKTMAFLQNYVKSAARMAQHASAAARQAERAAIVGGKMKQWFDAAKMYTGADLRSISSVGLRINADQFIWRMDGVIPLDAGVTDKLIVGEVVTKNGIKNCVIERETKTDVWVKVWTPKTKE